MDQRDDDEVWELVEVLRCKQNFEAKRALRTAARQKCFEAACHVKVGEEFDGCAGSGGIEIRSAQTKASEIFRRTWRSRGCGLLFPGGANEGAVEQKKQAEISSDGALEWARAGAPRQAARASSLTRGLADPKRAESGWEHACAVTILSALNENMVKLSETGFVEGREHFGRKVALRKLDTNNERENETHCDSELWLKHEHRTSTERLSIEGADGGTYYMCLWKSGRQIIRARASLTCSGIAVLARLNAQQRFGHPGSRWISKPGKASSSAFFGRQSGRKGSTRAGSHLGQECSMRLVDGVRQILRLGGGSGVGRRLFGGLKSVVIPSSVEVLCKSYVRECSSVESVMFEADSKLQRIEESAFLSSGLKLIIIPSSVEVLCKSCFSYCKSLSSITFESDSHLQRIEQSAFYSSGLKSIIIPLSVEVLRASCFGNCDSLSSVPFETCSKIVRIESTAFHGCSAFLGLSECVLRGSRALMNCRLVARRDELTLGRMHNRQ
jgi:hypothetical protein